MINSAAVRNWAIDLSKRAKPNAETTVEQAVELQAASGETRPYHQRAFVALGQAYAKDERFDAARDAWSRAVAFLTRHLG